MLLSFKIQAQLHIKGSNEPPEMAIVADGVKLKHSPLRVDIYDYC